MKKTTRTEINCDLFGPVQAGSLKLSSRIVMAPLTRSRAGKATRPFL